MYVLDLTAELSVSYTEHYLLSSSLPVQGSTLTQSACISPESLLSRLSLVLLT
jgi:hypothetical protein